MDVKICPNPGCKGKKDRKLVTKYSLNLSLALDDQEQTKVEFLAWSKNIDEFADQNVTTAFPETTKSFTTRKFDHLPNLGLVEITYFVKTDPNTGDDVNIFHKMEIQNKF